MKKLTPLLWFSLLAIVLVSASYATVYNPFTGKQDYVNDLNTQSTNLYIGNISGVMSWSNLTNYPAACPAGSAITQLGDSVTCTTMLTNPLNSDLKMNGYNIINASNITILGNLSANAGQFNNGVKINGNLVVDGNMSIKRPYIMLSSNETQIITTQDKAFPINFSTIEDNYLITISNDGQNITTTQSGDYLIELSALVTTDTPAKSFEIWAQKNGVNIPRSNTRVVITSATTETLIVVPFIIDLQATDYFGLRMASNDAGSELLYTTNTSYSPSTPSIIMTMTKISEITS